MVTSSRPKRINLPPAGQIKMTFTFPEEFAIRLKIEAVKNRIPMRQIVMTAIDSYIGDQPAE